MSTGKDRNGERWRTADRIVALLFGLLIWMCSAVIAAMVVLPEAGWAAAVLVAAAFIPAVAVIVTSLVAATSLR